jgi:predicted metal-dependent phosphotriesterase family hydrolase
MADRPEGFVRTVLGDRYSSPQGAVYSHEHLIIDSALIADRFPHIHLYDVDSAVAEVQSCRNAGVAVMIDAMPVSAGRDAVRLAEISRRTGVEIISATGLHHDRYYGPLHWTNRVQTDELARVFVADLIDGIDEFDYTGPVVRRTMHKAGIVKVATSGEKPDQRDLRNIDAAARASVLTGAPVLTHCEGGHGGLAQVELLLAAGVPAGSIILSHIDKVHDLAYLNDLAATGAVLELDQGLREYARGPDSITVRAIVSLIDAGYGRQVVVGTDGARRDLWTALGGRPGLAWLATALPPMLTAAGLSTAQVGDVMTSNAWEALTWRTPTQQTIDEHHHG